MSLVLLISTMMSLSSSCNKNDPTVSELSKLPEATQTGANTFGCLVNGQAFLPQSDSFNGHPSYQCNYIYTNGGFNFYVGSSNKNDFGSGTQVALATTLLPIIEGQSFKLGAYNSIENAFGVYNLISGTTITYSTTSIVNGQLYITKLDLSKQIVSGTFSFNAVNASKSDTIHVTDGRFDMKYTQ